MPFLLCFCAGLSTLIGAFFIFIKGNKNKIINYSISFASGVMLGVSIFDLLKESIIMFNNYLLVIIYIIIGMIIPLFIDKILPNENKLYKLGLFSMIAIIIHNIPEGIATYISTYTNIKLGIMISVAIAMHNIPEGISIAIPIYYSTKSRKKAFVYTFISGMSELLGAIIAHIFLKPIITDFIMGALFSIITGIMSYISIIELLPTALKYEKKKTIIFFLLGLVLMYINHLL